MYDYGVITTQLTLFYDIKIILDTRQVPIAFLDVFVNGKSC